MIRDAWDRLRDQLPESAARALETELIRRMANGESGRLALVFNLRRGEVKAFSVTDVRGITVSLLTE